MLLPPSRWHDACTSTVNQAQYQPDDGLYTWRRHDEVHQFGAEQRAPAVWFLAMISTAAFVAAVWLGLKHMENGDLETPCRRFGLPNPKHPLLSGEADCQPNLIGIPSDAWISKPDRSDSVWMDPQTTAYGRLLKLFPGLFDFCTPEAQRDSEPTVISENTAFTDEPTTAAFKQWYDDLMRHDHLNMSRVDWSKVQITIEATIECRRRRTAGGEQTRGCYCMARNEPYIYCTVSGYGTIANSYIVLHYNGCERRRVLLAARRDVCTTTATPRRNLSSTLLAELEYMWVHRKAQAWLRFVLRLIPTGPEPDITLLRADPCGIEECVFKTDTSRGVTDTIKITLGLVLSTPATPRIPTRLLIDALSLSGTQKDKPLVFRQPSNSAFYANG